jgi:transposase
LFGAAAHLGFAPFLGVLGGVPRLFGKAPSGRQRFTGVAALPATAHELFTGTTRPSLTATTVCELLHGLAGAHPGGPLTVVLDNARSPRCALVQTLAAPLESELLYLPPYSPTLTLLERLGKFVQKQWLYSTYSPDRTSFQRAIQACLAKVPTPYQAELASLLPLRFQTFTTVPVAGDSSPPGLASELTHPGITVLPMAA